MKVKFIPFTRLAIIKFERGRWLNIRFNKFPETGIWCITVGRFMLFNDYRLLDKHFEEIKRRSEANI